MPVNVFCPILRLAFPSGAPPDGGIGYAGRLAMQPVEVHRLGVTNSSLHPHRLTKHERLETIEPLLEPLRPQPSRASKVNDAVRRRRAHNILDPPYRVGGSCQQL